ncbi:MAG: hypothetical protein J0I84_22850 [Terrimonas sp.]|nr:hypothetical protein [Terrimonas sp.]OJY96983.1 MAG: hypothetical protein BGP13_25245 [Sphingobacteriales bacterium 40-81]
MMYILVILRRIIIFFILTLLTQIGGVVYLLNIFLYKYYSKASSCFKQFTFKLLGFVTLYFLISIFIVPHAAKQFGRVSLPIFAGDHIKPLNIITCLLNRHYVNATLKASLNDVAKQINMQYPNTVINYLDANFPFMDGFPLFPHLSHNDGKKLDISFHYLDAGTKQSTNDCPSFFGYGICEEPTGREENTSGICAGSGYWQYSFIRSITPQGNKHNFIFDGKKTKFTVNAFCENAKISKVFIEPHLKKRLKLMDNKVRFHGCQAVRHDDHIHVEVN